ncbi:MAG TPA: SDR family NAD(P)-dependent oxidoreductase [Myxococcales bacterium]|jgi:short-subunit dehydrogenase
MPSPTTILVTGASGGIGAAIAEHLAAPGVRVALFARRKDQLDEVARKVGQRGAEALVLVGDVADFESVEAAYAGLVAKWGSSIDFAYLNAGAGGVFPLSKFKADRVRRIFEVNILGLVNWLHFLLPPMLEARRGTIVGTSSMAAQRGGPNSGAYSASKAAVTNLLESIRLEARHSGVTVCTVEPGFVRTDMTAVNKFPMPFIMDPADAAKVICRAAQRGKSMIRFPWPLQAGMAVMRWMPNWMYDRVTGTMLGQDSE